MLVVALVASALLAGAGFAAGSLVKSPADVVAEQTPTPITTSARVEQRLVAPTIVLPGKMRGQTSLVVPAFVPTGAERAVVTNVAVAVGSTVQNGTVIAEISGRPIIVVNIATPLYRSLHAGDSGDDVRSVQTLLADLNFFSGTANSQFDPATQRALERFYKSRGYSAPSPSIDVVGRLDDARKNLAAVVAQSAGGQIVDLQGARRALTDAEAAAGPWLDWNEWIAAPPDAVLTTAAAPGSVLAAGEPVATLGSGRRTAVARANVLQLETLKVGIPVSISIVGSPGDAAQGAVSAIGPFVEADPQDPSGAESGRDVTVDVTGGPGLDLPNDSGVQIQSRPNVPPGPALPLTALRQDSAGTYVLVESKPPAAPRRVAVSVLRQSDGWAAISDGAVAIGDVVRTSP